MCFYFDLVSQIHKKIFFNWCLKWLRKKIIFPIIKDFETGWEEAMIFNPMADSWWFSWSLQTKQWRALLLKCDPPVLGSWRCIYMYVDTFVCIYIYIYIYMGRNPLRYRTPTDDQKLYGLIAYKKIFLDMY